MTTDQHIAEQIARAQDMLGRLGQREDYEVNYTSEKLATAMQACAVALGLCGYTPEDIGELAGKSASLGWTRADAATLTLEDVAGGRTRGPSR